MEPRDLKTCEVCAARVGELRRGRCWGCYSRWVESRPVGLGAACVSCGERRRGYLKQVELLRTWLPMCHNCAGRATQLSPMPNTLDEIRARLSRDRRAADRRATGKPDTRVFRRERRGLERRAVGHAHGDDLLLLDESDIILIEDSPSDPESRDETRIIQRE
jgi:hypothetical protein